ncbi:hypothetical protein MMC26_007255 [Xylographa opegraphella]|nr:hypothetical protein [Xylographa opegraphella]
MKTFVVVTAVAFLSTSFAITLRHADAEPAVIQVVLNNSPGFGYYANVSVGTPAQSVTLQIDTGSSNLWVNSATSTFCSTADHCAYGSYDANASSTSQYVNSRFNVTYIDASGASGDFVTDNFQIGNTTVNGLQFGIGNNSTSAQNVWGIGYGPTNENVPAAFVYPNTPLQMVKNGLIKAPAYSVYLNDIKSRTGSILFGGVDTACYQGELQSVPIIPYRGNYTILQVTLDSVNTTTNGNLNTTSSTDLPQVAVLDTGASGVLLPTDIAQQIWTTFGVEYSNANGLASCPCSLANNAGTVDFGFSGIKISVPVAEFVRPYPGNNAPSPGSCLFDVQPLLSYGSFSPILLGDPFLRSAYVVYDLGNNEISIAQTVYNAQSSNIMEIVNGTTGVPGASNATNIVTSVPTPTGSISPTGTPTGGAVSAAEVRRVPNAATVLGGLATVSVLFFLL